MDYAPAPQYTPHMRVVKGESQRLVRPVAVGRRLGPLALAQGDFFGFIYGKLNRFDPGPFV